MGEISIHMYRIYKTCLEMLRDRGYLVSKQEESMTKEDFFAQNGIQDGHGLDKEKLTLFKTKRSDPSKSIFVFFPDEPKVGIKTITKYLALMEMEKVERGIVVVQSDLSPFAKAALQQDVSRSLEYFKEAELLVNITRHVLVPQHQVLTDDQKKELLIRYKLRDTQLPRIQPGDPVARYYGLQKGQVVKIIRSSE
eukprot:CAMPEP_0119134004 /NCGR_PEP_ID=MMETSP1310-20130426/15081_1 /TAXON_ID=464262 /ORGANISM="Genus nov. species nov., Strain RCC2339" /LENGTH=194 /DNA_ID=CAMNT_0007124741 /DNA_START=63 /DNA_END=644 /DNA_ORIENTATION=+